MSIHFQTYFSLISLLLGLILGSFYNVCIYRYLQGKSIIRPGSHCPVCGHNLSWWENIPLFSYLLLKGRCRNCKEHISLRYPAVEAISGIWALLLAIEYSWGVPWLVYMFFGGVLIILSFIDLDSFILPDVITIPGTVAAILCAVFLLGLPWKTSIIGAIAGGGIFWIIQIAYRLIKKIEGLGSGDIKLMLMLGGLLGWQALPLAIFFAAASGLLVSLFYLYKDSSKGMKTEIPFGPFLSLGGMLYILWGRQIWIWYSSLFGLH